MYPPWTVPTFLVDTRLLVGDSVAVAWGSQWVDCTQACGDELHLSPSIDVTQVRDH